MGAEERFTARGELLSSRAGSAVVVGATSRAASAIRTSASDTSATVTAMRAVSVVAGAAAAAFHRTTIAAASTRVGAGFVAASVEDKPFVSHYPHAAG